MPRYVISGILLEVCLQMQALGVLPSVLSNYLVTACAGGAVCPHHCVEF